MRTERASLGAFTFTVELKGLDCFAIPIGHHILFLLHKDGFPLLMWSGFEVSYLTKRYASYRMDF